MFRYSKLVFSLAALLVFASAVRADTITVSGVNSGQASTAVAGSDVGITGVLELSTLMLLGSALLGLGGYARRRFKTRT